MIEPVSDFKTKAIHTSVGESLVYHVGNLGADIASSPTLTLIQMFAYGLHLMGRVGLRQKRVPQGIEYSLKVLHPVHSLDFDTARKTYLENLKN